MQKIPSYFKRDYEGTRLVYDEVVEGTEWVAAGEGVATVKTDGTSCRVKDGKLYRRHVVKEGKTPPTGWIHWSDNPEQLSGHGWAPVMDHASDQYHREAWEKMGGSLPDGTYELCGPKVQKNAEGCEGHLLIPHGHEELPDAPRDFDGLRAYLEGRDIEGIVWHHPDGRMAKIKLKDFGLKRSPLR